MVSGDDPRRNRIGYLDPEVSPETGREKLVDPADPSWNLLLSELRKPGAIVENGGQDYDASDTQRQTWSR